MKREILIVVLFTALGVAGCSKGTARVAGIRPDGQAGSVSRDLPAASGDSRPGAGPNALYYIDDDGTVHRAGGGDGPHVWTGGVGTLPFGVGISPDTILQRARRLRAVHRAMALMEERGYTRREDLDRAFNADSGATAVIAYEEPGFDPRDREPFILVLSRETPEIVYTQVIGTVWETGPDGKPVIAAAGSGANFILVAPQAARDAMQMSSRTSPMSFESNPWMWSAAFDIKYGKISEQTEYFVWDALSDALNCIMAMMYDWSAEAGQGLFWGAMNSAGQGVGRMAWGALCGLGAATTNWKWAHRAGFPCP